MMGVVAWNYLRIGLFDAWVGIPVHICVCWYIPLIFSISFAIEGTSNVCQGIVGRMSICCIGSIGIVERSINFGRNFVGSEWVGIWYLNLVVFQPVAKLDGNNSIRWVHLCQIEQCGFEMRAESLVIAKSISFGLELTLIKISTFLIVQIIRILHQGSIDASEPNTESFSWF